MITFKDQVLLVTGGGTGIGAATCRLFANHGAKVVVNFSRSKSDADALVDDLIQLGGEAVAIKADVANSDQVKNMFEVVEQTFGRLDVLVNNAGTTHPVPAREVESLTESMWDEIFGVNAKGTFLCSQRAIPLMRKNGGGQIVNVSSIAAITAKGSSLAYCASKAAISNLTKGMAVSQAPEIRVNEVAPGVVLTRWIKGWEDFMTQHESDTPMKRLATADDVAAAIHSLASNPFITGHSLIVDGGRSINV